MIGVELLFEELRPLRRRRILFFVAVDDFVAVDEEFGSRGDFLWCATIPTAREGGVRPGFGERRQTCRDIGDPSWHAAGERLWFQVD